MIINDRLKALMTERGVTWKQISEELKIGKNQPKYWEEKDTLPDGKTLIKLSQFFGVTVDYLLGVEDQNAVLMQRAFDILDESDTSEQEKALLADDGGYQFSHGLEETLGGLLKAGFSIEDLYEDVDGSGRLSDLRIPCYYAVKAKKK